MTMIEICATCKFWTFERRGDNGPIGRCRQGEPAISWSWHSCINHQFEERTMETQSDEEAKAALLVPVLKERAADLQAKRGDRGVRVFVPGGQSLIYVVRQGMKINPSPIKAAKLVGIAIQTFVFVRKLLIIKDERDLTEKERDTLEKALAFIDEHRMLSPAKKMTREILAKYWSGRTTNGLPALDRKDRRSNRSGKNKSRFESTLFTIREACSNNDEMVVPDLAEEEKKEALDLLVESMSGLWNLFYKIREEKSR